MRWSATWLALAGAGCSLALDPATTQCASDNQCADLGVEGGRCVDGFCRAPASPGTGGSGSGGGSGTGGTGGSVDPKWACLGSVVFEDADPAKPIEHQAIFRRLLGEDPIPDMTVVACTSFDTDCAEPVDSGVTDQDGMVTLTLFLGFTGFLKPETPASFPEMQPSMVVVNPPLTDDNSLGLAVHLTSIDELELAAAVLQVTPDPALGHIFGVSLDCNGEAISGVSLEIDTMARTTTPYYFLNGLPSKTATESDASGNCGFANVPPGFATITATSKDVGRVGALTVPIQPNHITYSPVAPSPD